MVAVRERLTSTRPPRRAALGRHLGELVETAITRRDPILGELAALALDHALSGDLRQAARIVGDLGVAQTRRQRRVAA